MYFQKLGNDGGRSLSRGDLKRSFETWRNTNRGSRYNRGTRRSMNKYVRYKRWLRRVEKHALRFRNLIETRYFDRGSGWKLIESRKRWNYFSLPPSSMKWNEKSQIDRCYSLLIELEASSLRHIERSVRNLSKSCISRKRFSLYRERFICRWERPVSFWRNEDECCLRKWISLIFTFVKHSSVLNAVNVIIIEIFAKERIFV